MASEPLLAEGQPNAGGAVGRRPRLAVLCNCLTPYRIHLHNCLLDELPEVELHTLVSHGSGDFRWAEEGERRFPVTDFSDPGDSANDNTLRAPHRIWKEAAKAKRIIAYLTEQEIDAIISLVPSYASYYWVLRKCRQLGVKVFVRSDANIENERFKSRTKLALKKLWYARWTPLVDGFMPMGELGRRFFRKYGASDDRMYLAPYWPDVRRYAERDEARVSAFCKEYSLDPTRKRLLYCGRLIRVKRVDLLIQAFRAVANERPDWDLLVMGAGSLEQELKGSIPSKLQDRVTWTGFLQADALVAGYHASHALVLPSDREPWALVVPEALAAGLPVIASDVVGAAREMVQPGVNGESFPAGNLAELTSALLKVTAEADYPQYRRNAPRLLDAWFKSASPAAEIRRALTDAGVLPVSRAGG